MWYVFYKKIRNKESELTEWSIGLCACSIVRERGSIVCVMGVMFEKNSLVFIGKHYIISSILIVI